MHLMTKWLQSGSWRNTNNAVNTFLKLETHDFMWHIISRHYALQIFYLLCITNSCLFIVINFVIRLVNIFLNISIYVLNIKSIFKFRNILYIIRVDSWLLFRCQISWAPICRILFLKFQMHFLQLPTSLL